MRYWIKVERVSKLGAGGYAVTLTILQVLQLQDSINQKFFVIRVGCHDSHVSYNNLWTINFSSDAH